MLNYAFTSVSVLPQGRSILRRDRDDAVFTSQKVRLSDLTDARKQGILKLFNLLPSMVSFSLWRVLYVTYNQASDIILTVSKGVPVTSLANLCFEASANCMCHSERELSIIYTQLVDLLAALCESNIQKPVLAAGMRFKLDPSCLWFDDRGLLRCDIVNLLLAGKIVTQGTEVSWVCAFIAAIGRLLYLLITADMPLTQSFSEPQLADLLITMQCYTIPYVGKYRQHFSKQLIDLVNALNQPSNLHRLSLAFLMKSPVYLFGKDMLRKILGTKGDGSGNSILHKLAFSTDKYPPSQLIIRSLTYLCRLQNAAGDTALQLAIRNGKTQLAESLIDEEAGCYAPDRELASELAILQGQTRLAKLLITFEGRFLYDRGYTSLMLAAAFAEQNRVKSGLLSQAKAQTNMGMTALHFAVLTIASIQNSIAKAEKEKESLFAEHKSIVTGDDLIASSTSTPRGVQQSPKLQHLVKSCNRGNLFARVSGNNLVMATPRTPSSGRRPITSKQRPLHNSIAVSNPNSDGIPERPHTQSYLQRTNSSSTSLRPFSPSRNISSSSKNRTAGHSRPTSIHSSPAHIQCSLSSSKQQISVKAPEMTVPKQNLLTMINEIQQNFLSEPVRIPALQLRQRANSSRKANVKTIEASIKELEIKIGALTFLIKECCDIMVQLIPLEKCMVDKTKSTALMLAARLNCSIAIKLLAKYEKGITNLVGETALMVAVRNNAIRAVSELIKHESRCVSSNRERYTALHVAVQTNNDNVVQLLAPLENNIPQAYYALDQLSYNKEAHVLAGITALMVASIVNSPAAAIILSEYEARKHEQAFGYTALMFAAYLNHPEIVEILLTLETKETMDNGWTALMIAASRGHLRCCTKLMPYEAKMHVHGLTALMIAGQYNSVEIVSLLHPLEHHIYHTRKKGSIVEKWACLTYAAAHGSLEVIEFLLKYRHAPSDIQLAIKVAQKKEISSLLRMYY